MNTNEKIYKTMTFGGLIGIVTGIVVIITSLTAGILMIVGGIKLINDKKGLTI